jgi:hypothetical protein
MNFLEYIFYFVSVGYTIFFVGVGYTIFFNSYLQSVSGFFSCSVQCKMLDFKEMFVHIRKWSISGLIAPSMIWNEPFEPPKSEFGLL